MAKGNIVEAQTSYPIYIYVYPEKHIYIIDINTHISIRIHCRNGIRLEVFQSIRDFSDNTPTPICHITTLTFRQPAESPPYLSYGINCNTRDCLIFFGRKFVKT